jgi:LacI family transcriptional regulator
MHAAGLEARPEYVRFGALFTDEEGARACEELLDAVPEVTAIVAGNDLMAIGCYDALERRGLSCPDDVSVVGFNDMPFVDRLRPPLTSVRIPKREIGQVAADLLLEQLGGGGEAASEILLEPTLAVRGSTAPPRRR